MQFLDIKYLIPNATGAVRNFMMVLGAPLALFTVWRSFFVLVSGVTYGYLIPLENP